MSHIDPAHFAFIVKVSEQTKIDPRVVISWMAQEGAFSGKETGRYNYLNIMNNGHPVSFSGVSDAISSTVNLIKQPNMKVIINTASSRPTPKEQISAIAASPWDAGHYGGNGGVNLQNTFGSIFGGTTGLNDSYVGPDQASVIANSALSGSATGRGIGVGTGKDPIGASANPASDAANAANNAARHIPGVAQVEDIGSLFKWIGGNWDRILFVIGGTILVILAIVFFMKNQANNTFTFERGE